MGRKLDSREFKLLLSGARFLGAPAASLAAPFWTALRGVIAQSLDRREDGPRHAGTFDTMLRRRVRFLDTPQGTLATSELNLRARAPLGAHGASSQPQVTLKLRSADFMAPALADMPGEGDSTATKFEEDVAPLQIADPASGGLIRPARPTTWSRYARSSDIQALLPQAPAWRDVVSLYPTIETLLARGVARPAGGTRLVFGPMVDEYVFRGAGVRLGGGVVADFSLTLWYIAVSESGESDHSAPAAAPTIAEISYRTDCEGGTVAAMPSRRAFTLFSALQTALFDWLEPRHPSKTALALPRAAATAGQD